MRWWRGRGELVGEGVRGRAGSRGGGAREEAGLARISCFAGLKRPTLGGHPIWEKSQHTREMDGGVSKAV